MVDIVTREQWGARPPLWQSFFDLPKHELVLHHLASDHHGPSGMRTIQAFHMDRRGFSDIAYSYCVDRDGTIYTARGAGVVGAHTKGHNNTAHAICAMGNYQVDPPTRALIEACGLLVAHGHRQGWWPDRITHGHRDLGSTACPGNHLYRAIGDINTIAQIHLTEPVPEPPPPGVEYWETDPMADQTQLVTLTHRAFGLYEGWWEPPKPFSVVKGVVPHGPNPETDGWWPDRFQYPRAQVRGKRVVLTSGRDKDYAGGATPTDLKVFVTVG